MSHRIEETIEWFHGQVGKATDCNSVIIGSSPVGTSICAQVAKLVDAQDLKSCGPQNPCRFDSGPGHHFSKTTCKSSRDMII